MSASRLLTLRTRLGGESVKEVWRYDSWQFSDSQALHRVLTIRDPGNRFQVSFSEIKGGYPIGTPRLG